MSCVVTIEGRQFHITGEDAEKVADSYKLVEYLTKLDRRLDVSEVQVIWHTSKPDGDLLFALIKVISILPNGKPVVGNLVRLSGNSTAVLNVYIDEYGDKWGLTVVQPRIAVGLLQCEELPAGMDDGGNPAAVAIREMLEETDQSIKAMPLILLGTFAPSPGLRGELVSLFAVEHKLTRAEILALANKSTGIASEGEYIQTRISRLDDILERTLDSKAIIAIMRYQSRK